MVLHEFVVDHDKHLLVYFEGDEKALESLIDTYIGSRSKPQVERNLTYQQAAILLQCGYKLLEVQATFYNKGEGLAKAS